MKMRAKQGIVGLFVLLGLISLLVGTYTKMLSFSVGLFLFLTFWLTASGISKFFSTTNDDKEIYSSSPRHKILSIIVSAILIGLVGESILFDNWLSYTFTVIAFVIVCYWMFSGIYITFTRKTVPEHYEGFM